MSQVRVELSSAPRRSNLLDAETLKRLHRLVRQPQQLVGVEF